MTLYKDTIVASYDHFDIGQYDTVNTISTESSTADESVAHVEEFLRQSSSNLNEVQIDSLRPLLYEHEDEFLNPHTTKTNYMIVRQ